MHSNITATCPVENRIVLKDNMAKNISLKPVKSSTDKPNNKPLPGDKTLEIDTDICFYEIEYSDKTEEG